MSGKRSKGHVSFKLLENKKGKFRSDARRKYVLEKTKRTYVISAIREEERQIQNAQVMSILSKSEDQKK